MVSLYTVELGFRYSHFCYVSGCSSCLFAYSVHFKVPSLIVHLETKQDTLLFFSLKKKKIKLYVNLSFKDEREARENVKREQDEAYRLSLEADRAKVGLVKCLLEQELNPKWVLVV